MSDTVYLIEDEFGDKIPVNPMEALNKIENFVDCCDLEIAIVRKAIAALPDHPMSETEIINIITQECWKKAPMIPQRIFKALCQSNALYVSDK